MSCMADPVFSLSACPHSFYKILSFLPEEGLAQCARVSKKWNSQVEQLWQQIAKKLQVQEDELLKTDAKLKAIIKAKVKHLLSQTEKAESILTKPVKTKQELEQGYLYLNHQKPIDKMALVKWQMEMRQKQVDHALIEKGCWAHFLLFTIGKSQFKKIKQLIEILQDRYEDEKSVEWGIRIAHYLFDENEIESLFQFIKHDLAKRPTIQKVVIHAIILHFCQAGKLRQALKCLYFFSRDHLGPWELKSLEAFFFYAGELKNLTIREQALEWLDEDYLSSYAFPLIQELVGKGDNVRALNIIKRYESQLLYHGTGAPELIKLYVQLGEIKTALRLTKSGQASLLFVLQEALLNSTQKHEETLKEVEALIQSYQEQASCHFL